MSSIESYKYLGVPFRAETGLDLFEWLKRQTTRLDKGLKIMQARAGAAPPMSRLTLYRTFLAPFTDYGAALLHLKLLELRSDRRRREVLAPIQSHWTEAACWIVGNVNRRARKTASSILGMVAPEERFAMTLPSFHQHIAVRAHRESPSRHLLSLPSPPQGTLYARVQHDPRVRGYANARSRARPDQKVTLQTFRRRQRKDWLLKESNVGKLGTYILRRADSGVDECLTIKSDYQRKLAIKWRTNTFNLQGNCFCERP